MSGLDFPIVNIAILEALNHYTKEYNRTTTRVPCYSNISSSWGNNKTEELLKQGGYVFEVESINVKGVINNCNIVDFKIKLTRQSADHTGNPIKRDILPNTSNQYQANHSDFKFSYELIYKIDSFVNIEMIPDYECQYNEYTYSMEGSLAYEYTDKIIDFIDTIKFKINEEEEDSNIVSIRENDND